MARTITYDKYLNMLAERTIDNTRQLKRGVEQRRNGMEDAYGYCFSAYGDAENPAKFYISLSPDYVYLQRFSFKLVIRPFAATIKGATDSAVVDVNARSLSIAGNAITPNPHDHSTEPHTHNLIDGMSFVHTASSTWSMKIDGVDITEYLQEQHDGDWISGEGVYPNNSLDEEIENFYDILDVISVMTAEGTDESLENANKLLRPRFKPVEIGSDAPFGVDAYLYLKYSNVNR